MTPRDQQGAAGEGGSHRESSLLPIGRLGVKYDSYPHDHALFTAIWIRVKVCCLRTQMGTFAETAIIDNRFLFADQEKQTSVFHQFLFLYIYTYIFKWKHICIHIHTHIYIYVFCNFKRKMKAQVIFLYPFTIYSSCKRKCVVSLFVDEETNGSYPCANGLNGLAIYA